jgi:transcriptional regulator with XRE-family HTH domain
MMTYSPFNSVFSKKRYFEETKVICHNLKHLKELSGLSYRKLSVALGFGPKSLLNYITNYVRPNRERLQAIVSYFGIEDIEDLCMDEHEFKRKYQ